MKKISNSLMFLALLQLVVFTSCQKDKHGKGYKADRVPNLSAQFIYDDVEIPERANIFGLDLFNNVESITNPGATLGRVLFYDTKLSISNEVSCSSCHNQKNGFSDQKALSDGVINHNTPRNSQSIANCLTQQTFFWDSRVNDLETLALQPIQNHNEMGFEKISDLVIKLDAVSYYPPLFEQAFGDSDISKERIASALAQFLNSMFSANSKFDQVLDNNDESLLTAAEKRGKELFMGEAGCNNCHGGFDLRGSWGDDWANIGLEEVYTDKGLGALQGNQGADGIFKIPTLRNIAVSAPYMHDGRFATLRQVIDHYSEGIVDHPNLDWRLRGNFDGSPSKLDLTDDQKNDLIAFLHTLTDESLLADLRFSDPFE